MAKHELNDDSVVVVIGSGAGGGTLANELCQKGFKVVLLEAGQTSVVDDLSQRRMVRLQSARMARQAYHLGQLARREGLSQSAGMDLQDRRRHYHALGGRFAAPPGA